MSVRYARTIEPQSLTYVCIYVKNFCEIRGNWGFSGLDLKKWGFFGVMGELFM